MLRYYITDRNAIGGELPLLRNIERLGVDIDLIQVRERDLCARNLARLVAAVRAAAHPRVRVLVNDRTDVALACGVDGVHLRSNSIGADEMRRLLPPNSVISVACHSVEEVRAAARQGADMALLAPIFETPGKGPALGLGILAEAARETVKVIALGGVTMENLSLIHI